MNPISIKEFNETDKKYAIYIKNKDTFYLVRRGLAEYLGKIPDQMFYGAKWENEDVIQFETSLTQKWRSHMIDYQKAVKDLRDKLIMTQAEFAKMLGVSFTSINRWENCFNRPTTAARKQIVQLCKENNIELKEVKE